MPKKKLPNKVEIPLLQHKFQEVNKIQIRNDHLPNNEKKRLGNFLTSFQDLFQSPDEKSPFTTKIKAKIKTTDETPVFSKSYPYPQALKQEVIKQVEKLLNGGIIRPSHSPYNSPVWIVPKKNEESKF